MKRDLAQLKGNQFDVLVVGGGIYGVCTAWDAALRGLSVGLIEKDDFGSATSSNSLKIIHGGLRYLQHADFRRMRESITERKILMRIAPHLVHPLACIIPTYGHALKGKEVMALALFINDLVGYDRNRLADPQKHLPRGKVISKEACKTIIPGINDEGLTGGAVWYDCQVHNSERLLMSILHSAARAGARVANYVEMTSFKVDGDRVTGVFARDTLSGDEFEIPARLVINSTGPWFKQVWASLNGRVPKKDVQLSAAMNLVVRKKLFETHAVGLSSQSEFKDEDAVVSRGSRLFFVVPWRDYSLIGTTHVRYQGDPGAFKIREQDVREFIAQVNEAYPAANLKREDVLFCYGGLLPMHGTNQRTGDVKLLKTYQIIDHRADGGVEGLLSVVSVKYTTARDVAEKTIDCALRKLGRKPVSSPTRSTPVYGGDIEHFETYLNKEQARGFCGLGPDVMEHLVRNYGSRYPEVVRQCKERPELQNGVCAESPVLRAEIIHAVREEMAVKLADVVRRRTELGSAGHPGDEALRTCAGLMADELSWDATRVQEELQETQSIYVPAPDAFARGKAQARPLNMIPLDETT
ncbi:MAG: FAD-dependent oxidoreductase [bacterium]